MTCNTRPSVRAFTVACLLAFACAASGGEDSLQNPFAPDSGTVCSALAAAARSDNIPLDGVDIPFDGSNLAPGDSVTALITLAEKAGKRSQWLMYIEALPGRPSQKEKRENSADVPQVWYTSAGEKLEFKRSNALANLRLLGPYDASDQPKATKPAQKHARVVLNPDWLGIGMDQAAAAMHRMAQSTNEDDFQVGTRPFSEAKLAKGRAAAAELKLTLAEQRSMAGGPLAMASYFQLVQQTPGLDHLFFRVVDVPSVWSVVRHIGVKVEFDLDSGKISAVDASPWNLGKAEAAYDLPLSLVLNGRPALDVKLIVAPPRPPLLLCGGIVGVIAESPSDRAVNLTLRIISAHRCAAPAN